MKDTRERPCGQDDRAVLFDQCDLRVERKIDEVKEHFLLPLAQFRVRTASLGVGGEERKHGLDVPRVVEDGEDTASVGTGCTWVNDGGCFDCAELSRSTLMMRCDCGDEFRAI